MNRPATIIVLGSGNGSTNLGDESMWEAAVGVVRSNIPEATVVTDAQPGWQPPVDAVCVDYLYWSLRRGYWLLGDRWARRLPKLESYLSYPGRVGFALRRLKKSRARARGRLQREWRQLIDEASLVVISGAGAITEDYTVHGIVSWALTAEWADQLDTPIFFVGQGVGPVESPRLRAVAGRMFAQADGISVREEQSAEVVRSLGGTSPAVAPDWAILAEPSHDDRRFAKDYLDDLGFGDRFLVVSFHRRQSTTRADIAALAEMLSKYARAAATRGYRLLYVSNMTQGRLSDDRQTADLLLAAMSPADRKLITVVRERLTAGQTRALIGATDGLLTTRYHPLIFALAEQVPAWGISYNDYYDQKLSGASAMFHVAGNVSRVLDELDANMILDQLAAQRIPAVDARLKASVSAPLAGIFEKMKGPASE